MQQQSWYVLGKNKAKGPFSTRELQDLLNQGKLTANSKVKPHKELTIAHLSDLGVVDQLPPLPEDVRMSSDNKALKQPVVKQAIIERNKSNKDTFSLLLIGKLMAYMALVILLAAGVLYQQYVRYENPHFERPEKMKVKDFQKLQQTMGAHRDQLAMDLVIAQDLSALWLVSNWNSPGLVEIQIESVSGKILSKEPFKATAQAKINDNSAQFTDINILQAANWSPGLYHYRVRYLESANHTNLWAKFVGLDQVSLPAFEGQVLFGFESPEQLSDILKVAQQKKLGKMQEVYQDIQMKYQTLESVAGQIRQLLSDVFKGPFTVQQWRENIRLFEQDYKKNFGAFFTSFVLQNNKGKGELLTQGVATEHRDEVYEHYRQLSRTAQNLGEASMSILQKLELLQHFPGKKQRQWWQRHIAKQFASIESQTRASAMRLDKKSL